MAYVTQAQLQTVISANDFNQWFDDLNTQNQATITTNFNTAAAMASTMVDAYLAGIYPVPFTGANVPEVCQAAALVFLCEMLFAKRYTPDQVNPWKSQADQWRKILNNIREEGTGLDAEFDRAFDVGFVVTAPLIYNAPSL